MSTAYTTPIGRPLTFERDKAQPVTFVLTDDEGAALNLTGKTLMFRIGALGAAAVYELELNLGTPSAGRATGSVQADVTPASYEYHVEDVDAARLLIRGPCTVRAVIGAAT